MVPMTGVHVYGGGEARFRDRVTEVTWSYM